jgi:cAMP-dependent protein kinase regulator
MSSPRAENPLDRALALSLGGDLEGALRCAASDVENDARSVVGLFVASRLLGDLGRREAALAGLEGAVARAVDSSNLPMAVAACRELERFGGGSGPCLDEIARTFASGSVRLERGPVEPPGLVAVGAGPALAAALGGAALLDRAEQAVRASAHAARSRSGAKLAPEPLFSALDPAGLRALIDVLLVSFVNAGERLIEQGATGAEAYVLARGEVEVQRVREDGGPSLRLARLGAGALFGEMALLSRAPRAASVIACRPSIVLVAPRDALDEVVARAPQVGVEFAAYCRHRMLENLVRTSSVLAAVRPEERAALFRMFVVRTFEPSDRLIMQGRESDGLFLIASGLVTVVVDGVVDSTLVAELGPGEVVGEIALVLRRPANADVIATQPTVALHLPRERFLELVQKHPKLLAQLYELAIKRDEETSTIVAQEAQDADELVIV